MHKKLNLNLIILSVLMVFSTLIPRELLAHSAVATLHYHMSGLSVSTPENFILTTNAFKFCESYNVATGACTGDQHVVPSDTGNPKSCDLVSVTDECVWASSLNMPAGLTFNYVKMVMMNGYTMKATGTYTDAQKAFSLSAPYYAITSDTCTTNNAITNIDGVIGQGSVDGTASAQVMTGHTVPGNETDNPPAAGQRFSGTKTTSPLKLSSMMGSAYENALVSNASSSTGVGDLGTAVWTGNSDTEMDYIVPLTSTYTTTGKQPKLTVAVNINNTVKSQTIDIHYGSTSVIAPNCLIWNAGVTMDLTLTD
mgnify:FL=1|jgi:hypothetical protein